MTEQHTCGYMLQKIERPVTIDITSTDDIPQHMRPTFVQGAGYMGGIPLDRVPMQYHKFIQAGTDIEWFDNGVPVLDCPQCGERLEYHRTA